MTVLCAHGHPVSLKPVIDVLQRWRISLASLLFFTIFLTNNFGVSTGHSAAGAPPAPPPAPPPPPPAPQDRDRQGQGQHQQQQQHQQHLLQQQEKQVQPKQHTRATFSHQDQHQTSGTPSPFLSNEPRRVPAGHVTRNSDGRPTGSAGGSAGSSQQAESVRSARHRSSYASSQQRARVRTQHYHVTNDVISSSSLSSSTPPSPSSPPSPRFRSSSSDFRLHRNMSSDVHTNVSSTSAQSDASSHVSSDVISHVSSVLDSEPTSGYRPASRPPASSHSRTITSVSTSHRSRNAGINPTSDRPSTTDHVTSPVAGTTSASGGAPSSSTRARKRHISQSTDRDDPAAAARERYVGLMTQASRRLSLRDQCLVAKDLASEVCSLPADWQYDCPRTKRMRQLHLRFCGAFPLYNAIRFRSSGRRRDCPLDEESEADCRRILSEVVSADQQASQIYCLFQNIASKFDCVDPFSAEWSCDHCKEAYKNWVCSQTIPYFHDNKRLEPCPRYCELVENRCPYIKPHLLDTYAGEQTFICRDWDDIPRQYFTSSSDWVDEPVVSYVQCHEPCMDGRMSTNSTSICISQMEKVIASSGKTAADTIGNDVQHAVDAAKHPLPASADLLPSGAVNHTDNNNNNSYNVTSPLAAGGASTGRQASLTCQWLCSVLLLVHSLFLACPLIHLTLPVSYHRVIGLT